MSPSVCHQMCPGFLQKIHSKWRPCLQKESAFSHTNSPAFTSEDSPPPRHFIAHPTPLYFISGSSSKITRVEWEKRRVGGKTFEPCAANPSRACCWLIAASCPACQCVWATCWHHLHRYRHGNRCWPTEVWILPISLLSTCKLRQSGVIIVHHHLRVLFFF